MEAVASIASPGIATWPPDGEIERKVRYQNNPSYKSQHIMIKNTMKSVCMKVMEKKNALPEA